MVGDCAAGVPLALGVTISCHGEPSSSRLSSSSCSLSSELSGAASSSPMAAASGEGTAGTRLLPAGTALALLGGLVYLGTLCAACKRYVLPTAPPPSLLGLGGARDPSVAFGGCTWGLCAAIPSWDHGAAALLTPKPHLPPCAALPGLTLHPCVSQPLRSKSSEEQPREG